MSQNVIVNSIETGFLSHGDGSLGYTHMRQGEGESSGVEGGTTSATALIGLLDYIERTAAPMDLGLAVRGMSSKERTKMLSQTTQAKDWLHLLATVITSITLEQAMKLRSHGQRRSTFHPMNL